MHRTCATFVANVGVQVAKVKQVVGGGNGSKASLQPPPDQLLAAARAASNGAGPASGATGRPPRRTAAARKILSPAVRESGNGVVDDRRTRAKHGAATVLASVTEVAATVAARQARTERLAAAKVARPAKGTTSASKPSARRVANPPRVRGAETLVAAKAAPLVRARRGSAPPAGGRVERPSASPASTNGRRRSTRPMTTAEAVLANAARPTKSAVAATPRRTPKVRSAGGRPRKLASRAPTKRAGPSQAPRGGVRTGAKGSKHLARENAPRVVRITALDPFERCGPRTSVVHLYRVVERRGDESSVHLVFFDRHGWYCEHGQACRAVDDVRRHGKQLGLTF